LSAPWVRALLDGRKTQTRRVINPQPPNVGDVTERTGVGFILFETEPGQWRIGGSQLSIASAWDLIRSSSPDLPYMPVWRCPFGTIGDRLWVRETFRLTEVPQFENERIFYLADGCEDPGVKWRPSRFMPRWASRVDLTITNIRAEPLQDITLGDIRKEGLPTKSTHDDWAAAWDEIHKDGDDWDSNPWVWVVTFRRERAS
jgi:hypothetical protein